MKTSAFLQTKWSKSGGRKAGVEVRIYIEAGYTSTGRSR